VIVAPVLDVDLFSDEMLDDPWATLRRLRDAGPVVHLAHELYDVYAIGRFKDVRSVLRDWETFSSAEGTGFCELAQLASRSTVAGSDPPVHDQLRKAMLDRLRLSEIKGVAPRIQARADALVGELVRRGSFDGVKDLAQRFVPDVVGDLFGITGDVLHRFASSAEVAFNVMGPPNERMQAAGPVVFDNLTLVASLTKRDMVPGGMGWALYDAGERGEISADMCSSLLLNYVGPGFDTTIKALGNALWLLGRNPEQWKLLAGDPTLIPAAINEILRIESPIQTWSRVCVGGTDVDGVGIPPGARLAVLIGSANRDERNYDDPDRFDIRRNPLDHLAFGHGIHVCVGSPLARLQLTAVLTALVQQATTLECGAPVRDLNNVTRGLSSLPVVVS
jgi:cytochrome P450